MEHAQAGPVTLVGRTPFGKATGGSRETARPRENINKCPDAANALPHVITYFCKTARADVSSAGENSARVCPVRGNPTATRKEHVSGVFSDAQPQLRGLGRGRIWLIGENQVSNMTLKYS